MSQNSNCSVGWNISIIFELRLVYGHMQMLIWPIPQQHVQDQRERERVGRALGPRGLGMK